MFNSLWYKSLIRPPFTPPDTVFAPAWAFLYSLMGLALLFYILEPAEKKTSGYVYFCIQLVLNLIWTPVFFGLKSMVWGLVIIILLDIFVILTIWKFFKVYKPSGVLLIPYLIWIIFATYLNIGYIVLN